MIRVSNSIKNRLPNGVVFRELFPKQWELRYGFFPTVARMLHRLAVYCLGCRAANKNRAVGKLKPPYPELYHFTPESNVGGILKEGLLPLRGVVYMTDWTDPVWCAKLKNPNSADAVRCFRIDTARLAASGHSIKIMNCFHEFTTDAVPPDCLSLTSICLGDKA